MDMNFRLTKHFFVLSLIVLFLGACSKNYLIVDLGEDGQENNGNSNNGSSNNGSNTKDDVLVTFNASVENRHVTRAMSPMAKGMQSWLCAYLANTSNSTDTTPIAEGNYVTSSPGVLAGIQGYKMYLNNNIYSFYAVSCNASTSVPTFNKGISEPLSNGIDYLWWDATHQDITRSQVNIPIVYQHVATQVVFTITEGTNITLNKVISGTITPPQPGATMNLSTGVITPEMEYGKAVTMGIKDYSLQYIMLPVRNTKPMTLILELLVNNESTARTYVAEVSLPDGELKAGNSYLFKAVINENSVSFPNVSIKEWTEVDESGNPIYPVQ